MKKILFIITALMLSIHMSAQYSVRNSNPVTTADGSEVTLYGCIVGSPGIYSFPSDKGVPFTKVGSDVQVYGGATVVGDEYFAVYYLEEGTIIHMPLTLTVYDTETWQVKRVYKDSNISGIPTDLAYDHQTKNIYGCFMNWDYSYAQTFGRLVFNEEEMTYDSEEIAQFPERMTAMTIDNDGQIYSIGTSGKFYKVNKSSGDVTVVGDTGAGSTQWGWQSACYDKASGKIFWAGNNEFFDQCLFEVNPTTGKAREIVNYSNHNYEQVVGLFIKQKFDEVVLPNGVEQFAAEFNNGSLTGNITFTMPDKFVDGTAITDGLSYKVLLNGKEYITKEAAPGAKIVQEITVPADDVYTIMVVAEAGSLKSASSQLTLFVGKDAPQAVSNVKASLKEEEGADYEVTLTWDASTMPQHGGFMNMDALCYKIVRYPGEQVIADNLKNTTYKDVLDKDMNGRFFYEVYAVCEGKQSEGVQSNNIKIGGNTVYPYSETFDDLYHFENYTVLDNNNDGSTWKFENNMAAYTYNQKNAADDYLVTPPMALRADRYYIFKFKANNTYPTEKVAAYVGSDETAGALNICIVEPTEVVYGKTLEAVGTFKPEKNGRYYFAIKAVSEPDRSTLYVDNIEIIEKTANGPKAVTNLVVKAGAKGALNATVSFTAPTENMDDSPLTSIKNVRISCNDVEITKLTDVVPGMDYVFKDEIDVIEGNRTYRVEVCNDYGYGNKAEATAYVGIDVPGKINNLRASEDLNEEGTVILTWDAPTIGLNGGYVDPEGLTYMISKGFASEDINNGNNTTFRDKLDMSKGKQVFEGYSIYADNSRGSGRSVWQTIVTVAGPSVIAPMNESLSGMHQLSGPWVATTIMGEVSESSWVPVDGTLQKSGSQDNDGGVWIYKASAADKQCRIESPKVDIRNLSKPVLSFWLFGNSTDAKVNVTVQPDFGDFEEIATVETVMGEWQRYSFDLSKYGKSRFVRIGFTGIPTEGSNEVMSLDNISIAEESEHNLQMLSAEFPQRTVVGEKAVFKFAFRNAGSSMVAADAFSINLYKNEKVAASLEGFDMQTGDYAELIIEDTPTVSDKEQNIYYIKIEYPVDEIADDNVSEKVAIELEYPSYPTVTDFKAELNGGAVGLSWNAPDLTNVSGRVSTESFEMYDKFIIDNIGDWSVYDGDKRKTILISLGAEPLEYPHAGKEMAWQVFNSLQAGIPFASWTPKTGEQMIVAMKAVGGDNDDWLISPALNGKAQTISFYAKTGMNAPYVPELLEVLYSSTDKEVGSFKKIGDTVELENVKEWNYYKFDLPEGAKYFALRCVSQDKFAVLVDDISYIPEGAKEQDLSLLGYNVYRDDVRLNDELIANIHYDDAAIEAGKDYVYNVTAVYDKGESRYSESRKVNTTGIEDIMSSEYAVKSVNGGISVNAKGLVRVYDMTGALVYSEMCNGSMTVSLQQGSYIVRINGNAQKISVR